MKCKQHKGIAKRILLFFLVCLLAFQLSSNFHLYSLKHDEYKQENTSLNLTPHIPILIENDEDFRSFPGTGTKEKPYRIENLNISTPFISYGINISDTTKYFVIQNCYINVKNVGVWISWIRNGTGLILNNTLVNHDANGIDLWAASGISIIDNRIYSNDQNGIVCIDSDYLLIENNFIGNNHINGISLRFSDNAIIRNNTLNNNQLGIEIYFNRNPFINLNLITNCNQFGMYFWEVNEATIKENRITDTEGIGIHFKDSAIIEILTNELTNNTIGLSLEESDSFMVFNNSISKNRNKGLLLFESMFNEISYNFIEENNGYGVYLNYSLNNLVHHNNFVSNNLGGASQGYSRAGMNNLWYINATQEGNYWNEQIGIDPYLIEGTSGEYDLYPLQEPVEIPRPSNNKPVKNQQLALILSTSSISFLIFCGITSFFFRKFIKKKQRTDVKYTLEYIKKKRQIAYSNDVGVALFRFGEKGGELIEGDLRNIELNIDVFVGFSYVTIGQGQRYETGVYGPLPAPSVKGHNIILFAFWGKDDVEGDPRFKGRQYYLVAVIFPEAKTEHLIANKTMNEKFSSYIKKHKYPNRMTLNELNFFREIVFV